MKISIVDYGAGNAVNVKNAFGKTGVRAEISGDGNNWKEADGVVFPGVGSFGTAVKNLGKRIDVLEEILERGTPFLGICLGMQLLMEASEESGEVSGLGEIPGKVKLFRGELPVPHMGWNKVKVVNSPLFEGLEEVYAYFVHSYYCVPLDSGVAAAETEYGLTFASAFWKKNIFATQFHPEKSGEDGLKILGNFVKEVKV